MSEPNCVCSNRSHRPEYLPNHWRHAKWMLRLHIILFKTQGHFTRNGSVCRTSHVRLSKLLERSKVHLEWVAIADVNGQHFFFFVVTVATLHRNICLRRIELSVCCVYRFLRRSPFIRYALGIFNVWFGGARITVRMAGATESLCCHCTSIRNIYYFLCVHDTEKKQIWVGLRPIPI